MSNARLYLVTFAAAAHCTTLRSWLLSPFDPPFFQESTSEHCTTACLAQFNVGMFLGWTSCSTALEDDASWMVSLSKVGTAVGCFLSMFIVDLVGRKISVLLTVVPVAVSSLLIIWDTSISYLYVASFIVGAAGGIVFTGGTAYVTETSPFHIRGLLCSCFVLTDYCGDLLGHAAGSFASVQQCSYATVSLATLQFAMFVWLPETPCYLLRRKRFGAAMDSLMFLRGSSDVSVEMDSTMKAVECDPRNIGVMSSLLHLASFTGGRNAILIGAGVMAVQAFSASVALTCYTRTILERIQHVRLQPDYTSIVLATVCLTSYLVSISLVDRLGRRPLIIVSTVGVSGCSFLLAIFFCMAENNVDSTNLQLLPFAAILFYAVCVSVGLASVPFVVINEIFPIYAKTTCVGLCLSINFTCSFIMSRVWDMVSLERNVYPVFWLVSGFNAFSILYLVYYLPETKGKSFLQIRNVFIERIGK